MTPAPGVAVWWPIRNQILVPFSAVLLAAVAVTSLTAALSAARRSERETFAQLNQLIATVGQSSFPYSANVLDMMRGLSGAEFAVFSGDGRLILTTLSDVAGLSQPYFDLPGDEPTFSLASAPRMHVGDREYFAATVRRSGPFGNDSTLLVLYPETRWRQARDAAIVPPLVVGGATLVVLAGVSLWLAQRFGSRIGAVQEQVAAIAGGEFREMTVDLRRDEIQELALSVNVMSRTLREQQQTLRRTERARLLGQLAAGLAHQLRNAVTGARLAVQIHSRRCAARDGTSGPGADPSAPDGDESLDVALRQLSLMEEQVKGLLSLGRAESRPTVSRKLSEVLRGVEALVGPACRHAEIAWTCGAPDAADPTIEDADGVQTVLVNLALNGIEAAGPNGAVSLVAEQATCWLTFVVSDSGPGPPPELAESLFEPFVTGKAEGVGFGLALAKQVAEQRGGTIEWTRQEGRTQFRLALPVPAEPARCRLRDD